MCQLIIYGNYGPLKYREWAAILFNKHSHVYISQWVLNNKLKYLRWQ